LGGGDDVVVSEVGHELVVEESVEDFGNDGEERDWSVVDWERFVFCFVHFDGFCVLECVGVFVLVDGVVEEGGEDGREKGGEVFDDGWFDLENVAGFVAVDGLEHLGDFWLGDVV